MNTIRTATRHLWICIMLTAGIPFCAVAEPQLSPGEKAAVAAVSIEHVTLRNIDAADAVARLRELEDALEYPLNVTVHALPSPDDTGETIFLKGRPKDVTTAGKILKLLDGFKERTGFLTRFNLQNTTAVQMKKRLLGLCRAAALPVRPEQFIIYPEGSRGALFFLGSRREGDQLQELRKTLDKERHLSFIETSRAAIDTFVTELFSRTGKILVYLLSALLLIALHYLLSVIPFAGKLYQRFFAAIWTKLIADFRGRDFALSVIKAAATVSVEATKEETEEEKNRAAAGEYPPPAGEVNARAREKAELYLDYRGINPRDTRVSQLLDTFIAAEFHNAGKGEK